MMEFQFLTTIIEVNIDDVIVMNLLNIVPRAEDKDTTSGQANRHLKRNCFESARSSVYCMVGSFVRI